VGVLWYKRLALFRKLDMVYLSFFHLRISLNPTIQHAPDVKRIRIRQNDLAMLEVLDCHLPVFRVQLPVAGVNRLANVGHFATFLRIPCATNQREIIPVPRSPIPIARAMRK
jgi:hypothetical protein